MRYGILGQLEVSDGARSVPLAQGRRRLLLAVLLLHANEPLSTDRLIDALWGDTPPPTAAGSLHNHISALRKALGEARLTRNGRGYRLQVEDGELDAQRFDVLSARGHAEEDPKRAAELLREALDLWRGPAFGDLAYEPALHEATTDLEERRLGAIEDRIDADLTLGAHAQLVAELDTLVGQHPLRERLRGQQMLALYRCGRQADALAAYADTRRHLVDELGIEPGPGLRELEGAILAQDPALGPSPTLPQLPRPLRHPWRLAAAGAVLLVAAATAVLITGRSEPESTRAAVAGQPGDLLVAIDPATNKLTRQVRVGGTPTSVAVGHDAAWVLNAGERSVTRLDLETDRTRTFSTESNIVALAAGNDELWAVQSRAVEPGRMFFGYGEPRQVTRIDPATGISRSATTLPVPQLSTIRLEPGSLVATDDHATWVLGRPGWVHRIDFRTDQQLTLRKHRASAIAAGDGQVWTYEPPDAIRLDPGNGRELARVTLPAGGIEALAVGEGAVWGTDGFAGVVWRIDPSTATAKTIDVGRGVDTVAVGAGAVWAASSELGTVSRIDPSSNTVVKTIKLPGTPRGLAVGGGRVWASVADTERALPAAGALSDTARVRALPGPPCSPVLTDRRGDPDFLIASSLPLGAARPTTLPMSDAVAYVVREHKFRAGRFTLGLQSCDDSSPETGGFTPLACKRMARLYARSPSLIGIVGPMNSECSWEMLPILNRAKGGPPSLVSPTNADPDLVRADRGAPPDLFAKLFPTGRRGYARVYPADDYALAAGALLAKQHGNGRVFYIEDEYSATGPSWPWFRRAARRAGVRIAGHRVWNVEAKQYRALAERVRASGADTVYIGSTPALNTGQVIRDLRRVLHGDAQLVGGESLTPLSLLYQQAGPAARGVLVTIPQLPEALGPTGREFVRGFGAGQLGHGVSMFDVHAAAATEVLLDAIARSDGTREGVARALKQTRVGDSVLGPLALDANGEPVRNPFNYVRIEHGGGGQDVIASTDGARLIGTVVPPPELVGPATH